MISQPQIPTTDTHSDLPVVRFSAPINLPASVRAATPTSPSLPRRRKPDNAILVLWLLLILLTGLIAGLFYVLFTPGTTIIPL